jgi:hypothetical protein
MFYRLAIGSFLWSMEGSNLYQSLFILLGCNIIQPMVVWRKQFILWEFFYFVYFRRSIGRTWMTCCNPSLGLATKARGCKVAGQERSSRVKESVREWTLTFLKEFPLWELESQWTFECSKGDYRGQNPMDWRIIYTIRKVLKCRCLKWAHMTHLDIWNTSYGQKKGWESNW